MHNILLLTVDPQMLDMAPPEWKDELDIDLEPIEGKLYDVCFVYERVDKNVEFKVREGHCVFVPGEPQTIKGFGTPFLRQFDTLMSFRKDLNHPNAMKGLVPCLTPWRVGLDETLEREGKPRHIRTINEMISRPIAKSKFMSMVVSNKPGTPLQRARLKLAKVLSENYPGLVDIYGRGINEIKDKADALDPYLFSIAVENSYIPNYITEKLTDCFVCGTVPLYSGCPNVENYYPGGFIQIDPWDIADTLKLIVELSKDPVGNYNKYLTSLYGSRQSLIYKHNIIARIRDYCRREVYGDPSYKKVTLIPDEVNYYW